jgi:FtsP/CotA-like multicopper oxidase with cupredoxin domain
MVMLLTEIDSDFHWAEEGTFVTQQQAGLTNQIFKEWNPIDYVPEYWLINGLSFPNTIHVDNAAISFGQWALAFPNYDPLVAGSISKTNTWSNTQFRTPGEKMLIRMINLGYETQPMHIHGYHLKVLGSDQRPWSWVNLAIGRWATPFNQGLEKNTVLIGSGETYELLIDFGQQALLSTYADGSGVGLGGDYPGGTQTRYDPTTNAPQSNTAVGSPEIPDSGVFGNPPYIGGPVVTGAVGLPGSSQLFPFHNHDDYKATNNGLYPGGQFTVVLPLP